MAEENDACSVAHGAPRARAHHRDGTARRAPVPASSRLPAPPAVTARSSRCSPAPYPGYLLRYAADAGYRTLLVEPDPAGPTPPGWLASPCSAPCLRTWTGADVVVTDHHREELGVALRDALATKARWVGIMGNPRHVGPHVAALESLGVTPADIARVHRPIGLNIGSRTPPEIAISTLAGLLADRNSRPGGFSF